MQIMFEIHPPILLKYVLCASLYGNDKKQHCIANAHIITEKLSRKFEQRTSQIAGDISRINSRESFRLGINPYVAVLLH